MKKEDSMTMGTDFKKVFKRLIIGAVLAVLVSGGVAGALAVSNADGIRKAVNYFQMKENEQEYLEHQSMYDDDDDYEDAMFLKKGTEGIYIDDYPVTMNEVAKVVSPIKDVVIAVGIFGGICALSLLAFWITIARYIYQSARQAEMNTTLWLLLAIFFSPATLIAFLLCRSFLRMQCRACGAWQKKAPVCRYCGAELYNAETPSEAETVVEAEVVEEAE